MDEVARHNIQRWQALADADAPFTRPALDMDADTARARVDAEGLLGDLSGRDVLCLASGGGQQSAAFALLGARVTVWDLSDAQLERDRQAAAHYGVQVVTVQGDMRDLSRLAPGSFDLVYQPYSLGFVPDAAAVFAQVARVLRPGGTYFVSINNPFSTGLSERDWNGGGYTLRLPYQEGLAVALPDPDWVYARSAPGRVPAVRESREYRHTFSGLLNGLLGLGFRLVHVSDSRDFHPDPEAPGGTWDHFVSVAPPWLSLWLRYEGNER